MSQRTAEPTVLAACAGIYRETLPLAALRKHFRYLWFHSIPDNITSRVAVVPDGYSDILWTGSALVVAGPDRTAAFPALNSNQTIIGLRFRPGAAPRWLRAPLDGLAGQVVPLEDFWGSDARHLEEQMTEAATTERRALILQGKLAHIACDLTSPAEDMRYAFEFLARPPLSSDKGLRNLTAALGVSERELRRRSREYFGYGPKTLERVLRFQRFLTLAKADTPLSLAELAAETGYADQAHMTREVRELSSLTPLQVLVQLAG